MKRPYAGKPVITGRPKAVILTKGTINARRCWAKKRAALMIGNSLPSAIPGPESHGKSVAFISAMLTGRKQPPEWMLADLGIERETVYRRKSERSIEEAGK